MECYDRLLGFCQPPVKEMVHKTCARLQTLRAKKLERLYQYMVPTESEGLWDSPLNQHSNQALRHRSQKKDPKDVGNNITYIE